MTKQSQQIEENNLQSYFPPTKEPFLDTFEQNNRSYQLFKEAGLDKDVAGLDDNPPHGPISTVEKILNKGLFRRLRPFLVEVDASKGPIQRKVIKLERRKGLKQQEYLVVHTEWIAKNYLGNSLISTVVLEGMYNEPVVQNQIVKGKVVKKYQNWNPVYDIPFSKEAVDKALEDQVNEPELVKFMVRTSQSSRDDSYSLEQFRDSTFQECIEIHKNGKGLNR
jgi:hypothetical protein